MHSLILLEDDARALEQACQSILASACAHAVVLIDKNGQLMAAVGDHSKLDLDALASLTAGNMAATDGLAKLLGEPGFGSIYHQGESESIQIESVLARMFVVVIFGDESSVGLVRLRLGQTLPKLEALVAGIYSRDSSIPLDITTNDISALLDED